MKNNIFIIISQASSSLSSFLLSVYILKLCSPEDYGNYTVVISLFFFSISIFNALISTPMLIEKGKYTEGIIRQFSKYTLLFILGMQVPTFLLLYFLDVPYSYLVPPLLISVVLVKEFLKTVTIWYADNKKYAYMDMIYLAVVIGFCVFGYFSEISNLLFVYLVICVSHVISIIPYAITFRKMMATFSQGNYSYKDEWVHIKDSLLGVFVTEVNSRGYVYFISVFFGKDILALINAPRIFTNPISSVSYAYVRFLKPKIASDVNNGNTDKAIKTTFVSYFILLSVIFALLLFAYVFKDYMLDFVFENFDKDNVILMFYLWSAVLVFQVANMFASSMLQVMKKFRVILRTSQLASCVIAIGLSAIHGFSLNYYYLPLLLVLSECVMLFRNSRYLVKYRRTQAES